MRWFVLVLCGAGIAATIAGCKSMEERTLPQPVMATPLELDPTEQYELVRWWSNGQQLLRLDDDASYALYEGQNRYAKPQERGRWSRQSYAVLWLEPYGGRSPRPTRVRVMKVDDTIALQVRDLKPLLALKAPPPSIEDRLIGQWHGVLGELELEPQMRYTLRPGELKGDGADGRLIAGHDGVWSVVNGALVLQPDTPIVSPLRLEIHEADDTVTLHAPAGEMTPAQKNG